MRYNSAFNLHTYSERQRDFLVICFFGILFERIFDSQPGKFGKIPLNWCFIVLPL